MGQKNSYKYIVTSYITPQIAVITPITNLFSAIYRGYYSTYKW